MNVHKTFHFSGVRRSLRKPNCLESTNEVNALSLPEEAWKRLGYGGCPVYPVESGEYLYPAGEHMDRFDDSVLMNERIVLRNTKGTYSEFLNTAGDRWICTYTEYHSAWKTCGCKDATYMHYYIRTQVVDSKTRAILWQSNGTNFILDS